MKSKKRSEYLFQYFLLVILFLIVLFGCEEPVPHRVVIPDIDDVLPTFALTIIGPEIGSKTIRSDSRCSVSSGSFAVPWDTIFVQLAAGVEYKFTLTAYDEGGVLRTFFQTIDSTKLDIVKINEEEVVVYNAEGTNDKTAELYSVAGDPRRSMAITGNIKAIGTGRARVTIGAIDYGGRAAENNFDAGVLTFLYAPSYRGEVFYEGDCP